MMARLRDGEKLDKENELQHLLDYHLFGLRESEIAEELGWERRTVNNYLRELEKQGRAYKEGRDWYREEAESW
jgi:predicted transcriptional regulator